MFGNVNRKKIDFVLSCVPLHDFDKNLIPCQQSIPKFPTLSQQANVQFKQYIYLASLRNLSLFEVVNKCWSHICCSLT